MFARGEMLTRTLQTFAYQADTIEVLAPGTQTTIQDWPGRLGYWAVGVPPSGPMDPLSFRLANRLVGNDEGAAGIETTLSGPTLKFNSRRRHLPWRRRARGDARRRAGRRTGSAVAVKAGQVLKIGGVTGPGVRAYIAVRGGIDVPYISAAARPSRSASSAAMAGARSRRATCCTSARSIGGIRTVALPAD